MGSMCSTKSQEQEQQQEELSKIRNETGKTLILRDRDRAVYGAVRHTIGNGECKHISVDLKDAGTYYRMAILVEEEGDRVTPTDPPLFIDMEDLFAKNTMAVRRDDQGKYYIEMKSE